MARTKGAKNKEKLLDMAISEQQIKDYIRICANGVPSYLAMLNAGFNELYTQRHHLEFAEKYKNQISSFGQKDKNDVADDYTIQDSINTFKAIQKEALATDYSTGKPINLLAAIKCEENVARLKGFYIEDNLQQNQIQAVYINNEAVKVNANRV